MSELSDLDEIVEAAVGKWWDFPEHDKGVSVMQTVFYVEQELDRAVDSEQVAESLRRLEVSGRIQALGCIQRATKLHTQTGAETPGAIAQRRWFPS